MNTNLDTGATVNTPQVTFGRGGVGDGSFHDWIPDVEARQFAGIDENGISRSLNGRLTYSHQVWCSNASAFETAPAVPDIHKVLCSADEIAYKEQQDFKSGTQWWLRDSESQ